MNEDTMKDLVRRIADPDTVSPFSNGFVTLTDEEMVKFAELIVRECASYAFSDDQDHRAMLTHFGIEE